jgi:hypothetical protein
MVAAQVGTVCTGPSAPSTATARRAVVRATSNSSTISLSVRYGVSGGYRPAPIRGRMISAIVRYGELSNRADPVSVPVCRRNELAVE